ncbi:hypothetical protein DVH24_007524 [Malus domestica]|uniref:Uncharacterized protein n=1 Tax=Malus domestica TaxID=3750 RepID=A0A498HFL9_MALDO|nr:hypothetical protein DVH24_007524 [Malus domestica]
MNATAPPDVIQVINYQNGSDSDTNIDDNDDAPAAKFYQPVSAVDSEDDEDQIGPDPFPVALQRRHCQSGRRRNLVSLAKRRRRADDEAEAEEVEEEVASDSDQRGFDGLNGLLESE